MNGPRITVVMPVYNGERYLRQAIESILCQTERDFEFLVIDDGCTDKSVEIVRSYRDDRIRLIRNGSNRGLVFSLNAGLHLARGQYLARMDCDDISLPERLARQAAFLDRHPEIGACGTWIRTFGRGIPRTVRYPVHPEAVRCHLFYNPGIAHPTAMMRRSLFVDAKLFYDASYLHAEDYELWTRAACQMRLANIPAVLLHYRLSDSHITELHRNRQRESAARVREHQLGLLGIIPTEEEKQVHAFIMDVKPARPGFGFFRVCSWIGKIHAANNRTAVFPSFRFSRMLMKTLIKTTLVYGYYGSKKLIGLY